MCSAWLSWKSRPCRGNKQDGRPLPAKKFDRQNQSWKTSSFITSTSLGKARQAGSGKMATPRDGSESRFPRSFMSLTLRRILATSRPAWEMLDNRGFRS
jgi:hypothetical protein